MTSRMSESLRTDNRVSALEDRVAELVALVRALEKRLHHDDSIRDKPSDIAAIRMNQAQPAPGWPEREPPK